MGQIKLNVKQYFGGVVMKSMSLDMEEAETQLGYFWTKDGSSNIVVSIDGQTVNSYEDLVKITAQDRYKDSETINVGVFLSNDGTKSIWPK